MDVVVVESPTKARTLNRYLGRDYTVVASYGHVRDLPPRDGSVRPDDDFAMSWQIADRAERALREIARALKGARRLYLATDPDREGEAISWHVREVLDQRHALKDVEVKRVAFNEVTKSAVLNAIAHPRELNDELIDAYLARRALDYLVGFSLSPVLWRKLPGSRSAGRVQSVALRLVCERESEIEAFRAREYWTVEANFTTDAGAFSARLTHLDGRKLERYGIPDKAAADAAVAAVEGRAFRVASVERRRVKRNPQPPFTTSTLQQEAARKLRFNAQHTMRTAQQLYEGVDLGGERVGLITYMRTDSVQVSREAVAACRRAIGAAYGRNYVPEKPRAYRTRAKNAQEAHEAIRPADFARRPEALGGQLGEDQRRLYELIWKRALASQMPSAEFDQVTAELESEDGRARLRATGSTLAFDGFLRLYQEGRDDPAEDDAEARALPPLTEGTAPRRTAVRAEQHFTQPPPRFTEASLVKRLEELGIGRPSTYAGILTILKDRAYVRLEKGRVVPEDRGRLVTAFLTSFFERYVEYDFTAQLEDRLDDISGGRVDWKAVLRDFWSAFGPAVDRTKDLKTSDVIDALDAALGDRLFRPVDGTEDARACPSCEGGRLGLKLGKFGAFIGCSNYPDCRFTRPLAVPADGTAPHQAGGDGPRALGNDPESGEPITLRTGPYGPYLQRGETGPGTKPKRVSLAKLAEPEAVDLPMASRLLALPRRVGTHPDTGKDIRAGIGRFGPYIEHEGRYRSLESVDELLTIGENRAVALVNEPAGRRGGEPLHELGRHPEDNRPVSIMKGRYGPYVKHGRVNAPIPKGREPDTITLEEAVPLLAARKARGPAKRSRRSTTRGRRPAAASG